MSKINQPIAALYGFEPMREGEFPAAFVVGHPLGTDVSEVTKITFREDNYGDYGLGWYDIWSEDSIVISVAARAVAEVRYQS